MSWQPAYDPKPGDRLSCDAIETVIVPRSRDTAAFKCGGRFPQLSGRWLVPSFSST